MSEMEATETGSEAGGNASREPSKGRPPLWRIVLRTIIGNVVVALDTVILGLLASVAGWLPPRGHWMYQLARLWSRLNLWVCGVRLEVERESPLEPGRGYIYMSNHQSMFDIPVLIGSIPGQTRFMAKKSLFKIPAFGWALSAGGFIPVDRGNRRAAAETYRIAVEHIDKGHSILIFPEQTRSPDGDLLPFKRGGVVIAQQTGAAIVPVGIRGTREIRPKGSSLVIPGSVRVRYGKPIELAELGETETAELVAKVRSEVERLLA